MKPSSARVRPRVEVVYSPLRWAARQSDSRAMWKIRPIRTACPRRSPPAQRVVVHRHAGDAPVQGQHPGLGLDQLGGEHAVYGAEQRIPPQQLEIAGQLLDPVDLTAPLHLHRHVSAGGIATQQVDRPDRRRVLPADQRPALAERLGMLGEQRLQMSLDPVLDQPRIDAQLVTRVVLHRRQRDLQGVPVAAADLPHLRQPGGGLGSSAGAPRRCTAGSSSSAACTPGRRHGWTPTVRLHQDQPLRHRQMGRQPTRVVHLTPGDDESHGQAIYP